MSRTILRAVTLTAAALLFLLVSLPAFSDSQVRIVRLSYIEGGVQIDRGMGFDKAMVNLPISQGTWLRTSDDGRAEVEFEDGSALRLTPNTTIEFPQLSLRDSGEKVSTVNVKRGTAYIDFAGNKDNAFTLQVGQQKIALSHAVRLRADIADDKAAVAVLKGDAQVDAASGAVLLKKGQTANFELANADSADNVTLAKNVQHEPYDDWDKHQSEYRQRYASNAYNSYSPYAYGTADMSYYGNFFNAPGYGTMWRPYFAGANWDPFMNGAWAFSPGFGYGWVSSYPWGWTPYHYGTWAFVPGYGWAWQPGGAWMPWYSQPLIRNAPSGFSAPRPPTGGVTTTVVNRGPVPVISGGRVIIRNDSAGLGIRRGEINNLAKVSRQVEQKGAVAAPVRSTAATSSGDMSRSAQRGPQTAGPSSSAQRGSQTMSRGGSGGGASAPMSRPPSAPSPGPSPSMGGSGGGSHRGR